MFSVNLIIAGMLSAIGIVLIAAKFSRQWLLRLLGYDYIFDVVITLGFMAFMAGTYSGAMVAIINGICISVVLWVTKNIIGYEKLVFEKDNIHWDYFPGTWTMTKAGMHARKLFMIVLKSIYEFMKGWRKK